VKTISIQRAADLVRQLSSDPLGQLGYENILMLMEIRDNAIHFHHADHGLNKRVQEIGAAALRNFVYAMKTWFDRDLSEYQFALMPFAFIAPTGIVQAILADTHTDAARKVQKLLADKEAAFPFDVTKPYNVGIEVELRFVRGTGTSAISVKLSPDDPDAVPVSISEEGLLQNYPWRYNDLRRALRKRYVDFKENSIFHDIRKPLETDQKFCRVRHLDPKNKKSPRQKFYNPNIVQQFDGHYTLMPLTAR
jgi:hypothetical protein